MCARLEPHLDVHVPSPPCMRTQGAAQSPSIPPPSYKLPRARGVSMATSAEAFGVVSPDVDKVAMEAYDGCVSWIKANLKKENQHGGKIYVDVCEFLTQGVVPQPAERACLFASLKALDEKAVAIVEATAGQSGVQALMVDHQETIPPRPVVGQPSRHNIRLWQCRFDEKGSPKGSSPTCDVFENLRRAMLTENGLNTQKYNLDVFFDKGGEPASRIEDGSISLNGGFGVVLAAYLFAIHAVNVKILDCEMRDQATLRRLLPLAKLLMKALRLSAVYDPKSDVKEQVFSCLQAKITKANSQRPNILQYLDAFELSMAGEHKQGRSKIELLTATINAHNKK